MVAEMYKLRVGLLGIGLEAYWSQSAGLEDRLKGYVAEVAGFVAGSERTVINFGLVDTPEKAWQHRTRVAEKIFTCCWSTAQPMHFRR
jgi:L-arabinose isomerase